MTPEQKDQVTALRLAFAMERRTQYLGRDDEVAAELRRLQAQVEALQADAERYRFLRMQHWSESNICVVSSPKEAVKLGYDCPCTDRLDAAIDAQIAARKDQQ